MNINEVEIKFEELKANLINPRTAKELKEYGYDVDKLIEVINIYLKNLQNISNNNLLQTIKEKVVNLLTYTNQSSISAYLHKFEKEANFLILKVPHDEQNIDIDESEKSIDIEDLENKYNELDSTIINLKDQLDSSILNLTNQFGQVTEGLSNCAQNFNLHDKILKEIQQENIELEDKKKIYDIEIEKLKIAQDEYKNAKNAALNDVKLKKSLKYWEIKQKRHNKKFWIFMVIAVTLICSLMGFLYYEINSHKNEKKKLPSITPISSNISDKSKERENNLNNKSEEKEQKNIPNELKVQKEGKDNKSLQIDVNVQIENLTKQYKEESNLESKETSDKKDENSFLQDFEDSNLPWYFLMIFASSSAFWIIRITVKIALSNLHLSEDAHERVVMIYTYLSFVQKGQLDDEKEDKKLILSSLFRPSNIGIIQDESSVTVADIITAFKK